MISRLLHIQLYAQFTAKIPSGKAPKAFSVTLGLLTQKDPHLSVVGDIFFTMERNAHFLPPGSNGV